MQPPLSSPANGPHCRSTHAIVNLDAIAANVRTFRSLAPASQVIAVVKADAYGHGSVPVAAAALKAGAAQLAVYTVDEAIALRSAGIGAPVVLLGPIEPRDAAVVRESSLAPTVSDIRSLRVLESGGGASRLPVHLKVDTGLTRAGASPREAVALGRFIQGHPGLYLASVFTHFARADEPSSGQTANQLRLFLAVVAEMETQGVHVPAVHASNSAGALNFPEARLDAMRVGIGMYGYDPSRSADPGVALTPALTLRSRLTRVVRVPAGTGVGYGHEFRAPGPAVIGLVPIGYGDGLPRQLGVNRGRVLIHQQPVPIVGRVSMDQITVDLTGVENAEVGDEVILIGQSGVISQTADDVGDQAGTISYDVLTGLLPRVPRVYVEGSTVVGLSRMGRYSRLAPDS